MKATILYTHGIIFYISKNVGQSKTIKNNLNLGMLTYLLKRFFLFQGDKIKSKNVDVEEKYIEEYKYLR